MANRQQRRRKTKGAPRHARMTKDQKINALMKNGITPEDLKKEFERGYNAGFSDAAPSTVKTIYAAICLALSDLHGFSSKRCSRVLNRVDHHVIDTLTSADAVEAVYKRMKLTIDFADPSGCAWEDDV